MCPVGPAALLRVPAAADDVDVAQVSRPMIVALGATLAFAVAWMFFLRPQPVADEAVAPPGAAAPATAAPKATTGIRAATAPATRGDAAPGDPSRPLIAALDAGRVAVVLFHAGAGADDRAARDALDGVRGPGITKRTVAIERVGDYEAITRGVQVTGSPTVLVISPDRRARTITGYTDTAEITQAIGDMRAPRR